jgi:hypothetical protein
MAEPEELPDDEEASAEPPEDEEAPVEPPDDEEGPPELPDDEEAPEEEAPDEEPPDAEPSGSRPPGVVEMDLELLEQLLMISSSQKERPRTVLGNRMVRRL